MNAILRPDTCSTCAYRHRDGATIQCRQGPPSAAPFITPGPMGQAVVNTVTVWPVVEPDWHCGSHPAIAAKARAGLLAQPAMSSET